MAKIDTTHKLVLEALETDPETRSDDYLLILNVLSNYVTPDLPLGSILKHHVELGIPSIETITRCRRKIQKMRPELVDPKTKKIRRKERKEFKQYATI